MENAKNVLIGILDGLDDTERMLAMILLVSIFDGVIINNA